MSIRALFISAGLLLAIPAYAQQQQAAPVEAPAGKAPEAQARPLDRLLDQLKDAKTPSEARSLILQIERLWMQSGSDTVDLLFQRVVQAMEAKDADLALELFDSMLALKPDWAEGWFRRAVVDFIRQDLDATMRDLSMTLQLEPRHYGAIGMIGAVYLRLENKKRALEAFKQALAINPYLDEIKGSFERLSKSVEGAPI